MVTAISVRFTVIDCEPTNDCSYIETTHIFDEKVTFVMTLQNAVFMEKLLHDGRHVRQSSLIGKIAAKRGKLVVVHHAEKEASHCACACQSSFW
jgi:hypothetical protein